MLGLRSSDLAFKRASALGLGGYGVRGPRAGWGGGHSRMSAGQAALLEGRSETRFRLCLGGTELAGGQPVRAMKAGMAPGADRAGSRGDRRARCASRIAEAAGIADYRRGSGCSLARSHSGGERGGGDAGAGQDDSRDRSRDGAEPYHRSVAHSAYLCQAQHRPAG